VHAPFSSRPLIYEIYARTWLTRLAAQSGTRTLAEVPEEEIERLAGLGIDYLWLMGVWPSGSRGIAIAGSHSALDEQYRQALPDFTPADIGGSPYAVAGTAVDPLLGGPDALAVLRTRLAARGIGLLLDFVPNHTGLDHPWAREHPERYLAGSAEELAAAPHDFVAVETVDGPRILAHGRDPHYPPWTDTLQLNAARPETRAALAAQLLAIAAQCDGVRCDMAMLLLDEVFRRTWGERPARGLAPGPLGPAGPLRGELWRELIAAVRAVHPRFLLVAEVYWGLEGRLRSLGFDLVYDKTYRDRLVHGSAGDVHAHLRDVPDQDGMLRFLENHDEQRAAVLPWERHRAAAVLAATVPGGVLLQEGQLTGAAVRVPVQLRRAPVEPEHPEISDFYRRLLETLADPVLRRGRWRLLPIVPAWDTNPSWQGFVACEWRLDDELRLVVVNDAPTRGQCYVLLGEGRLAGRPVVLADRLGPAVYQRDGTQLEERGLFLDLPAYGVHLFEVV
jgi:hypothetical protein